MEKCKNVCFIAKWVKFLHKRVKGIRESQRSKGEIKERGPFDVWFGPLFIELSYVTRSELSWRENSKWGKVLDNVNGLLFFGQKKKVWDFKAEIIAVTAINHSYYSWMMSSEWHHLLGGKYLALNSWFG